MRGLLTVLGLVCHTESMCSPTSYYKNCWIRRFPGIFIDVEASQRRGAQLLRSFPEDTAQECSRSCCLARNLSCNLAVFHFDAASCVHLHCPSLESCIVRHRENVVLYNITKGVDPDLLVFGKHFSSNVRVLPHHYSRVNASDPLPSDKRNFIHPPPHPVRPPTAAPSVKPPVPPTAATSTAQQRTTDSTTKAAFADQTSPSSDGHVRTAILTTAARSAESSVATSNSVTSPTSVDPETPAGFSTTTAKPFASIPATTVHKATSSASATTALTGETEHSSADVTAGGNRTAGGDEGQEVGEDDTVEELGSGWHVAAHTLLVAVAICVTLLLSCCCSVLLVVSWRGQRKRMGRYRTSWRGKRASMRLIKYVLVKENS